MKVKWQHVGITAVALLAGPAHAQVQSGPGFFGYIDGMYVLPTDTGQQHLLADRAGSGWSVDGKVGYRLGGPWDVVVGGRYFDQAKGRNRFSGISNRGDGTYWNIDGEVGHTLSGPGWGVRPFLGVRYQHWRMTAYKFSTFGLSDSSADHDAWGIGPRLGVDAAINLSGPISLFGGLDTSFLYGRVTDTVKNTPGRGGGGVPLVPAKNARTNSRLIWDIGARLGVDLEVAPQVHVAVGYKVEWFDGIQSRDFGRGRAGELIHGPFLRLAYSWGAPPGGTVDGPPAPVSPIRSFFVFFDFDRATLTTTAVQTIKQAAEQAKAGRWTRIDVTGHADRAGGDAYNMALSLRRANTVKDQLVREGIGASQIVVVGRGESQPLVPTADGVREPQNRRVDIVIN